MSASNPGLHAFSAHDATVKNDQTVRLDAKDIEDKSAAAAVPDQFHDKCLTSKWEIWAYYA